MKFKYCPYLVLIGLLLIAALFTGLSDSAQQAIRLYADQRFISHFWGALTGYFVHNSWPHYIENAIGVILWAFIYGKLKSWYYWLGITLFVILAIDLGILVHANFSWYVGFSGVLHGLLAHGTLIDRGLRLSINRLLLIVLCVKVAAESLGLLPDFSKNLTGIDTASDTHLYGLLAGILSGLLQNIVARERPSKS